MLDDLMPGDQLPRSEVHARYGGRLQGGIGPSQRAKVVLFFTNPSAGRDGYRDGWGDDGLFHYIGEGQRGDQRLVQGNKAILNHREDGRTLEGFRVDGPNVRYLGEFELDGYYFTDAYEIDDPHMLRQVVVFKLRPLNDVVVELPNVPVSPAAVPRMRAVPVEEARFELARLRPSRQVYDVQQTERDLVRRYWQYLESHGHQVRRLRIVPPGEARTLHADLWDETTAELIEAKSTVTRDKIQLAVGQLFDYGRFVRPASLALLVPSKPRPDLLAFLGRVGVVVIYPDGNDWIRIAPGRTDDQTGAQPKRPATHPPI